MNWKVAVKRLKGIRDNYEDTLYWATEMAQIVRDIYGDDSLQHRETYQYYTTYVSAKQLRSDNGNYIKGFLSSMIATIERDKYINQPPRGNYLSRLDNQTITWILGALFACAFFIGKYATEVDDLKEKSIVVANNPSMISSGNSSNITESAEKIHIPKVDSTK